ncbi:hypothetical protein RJ640_021837 [Escallonia rubra]|uniref:S-RNase n=1 Tax=Escallonia rubra TaxID=112253 RepID=A0AA88RBK3_9ASTE|nr:hypothetical protein RJ640_021837 [Escallonia rubra]
MATTSLVPTLLIIGCLGRATLRPTISPIFGMLVPWRSPPLTLLEFFHSLDNGHGGSQAVRFPSPTFCDPAYVRILTARWPNLKNPDKSQGFWSYEWKKNGTCSENLYPLQAYLNLAMQLHDRPNLLQVFVKSNIKPGASGNQLLSRLNNSLVASTSKVPDLTVC